MRVLCTVSVTGGERRETLAARLFVDCLIIEYPVHHGGERLQTDE